MIKKRRLKAGPGPKGLTLLETMMAMVVAFVGFTLLMGTLVSAAQFTQSSKEGSVATMLAQTQLDQLSIYAPEDLNNSSGHYSKPFDSYLYNITLSSFASHMDQLTLTVTTPGQRVVSLSTLMHDVTLYGIVPKQNSIPNGKIDITYQDVPSGTIRHLTGAAPGSYVSTVENVLPGGCKLTTIGGDPFGNMIFGGDAGNWDVFDATLFNGTTASDGNDAPSCCDPNPGVCWAPKTDGASSEPPFGRVGGITCSWNLPYRGSEIVLVTDRTNHWVDHGWLYSHRDYDWKGHDFPAGPHTLGEPLGIATGYGATSTWVGDITNVCLRHSMLNDWWSTWDQTLFRPRGMAIPLGVACTPWSDFVFVDDPNNLWVMAPPASTLSISTITKNTSNGTWWKIALPTDLVAAWPSGIAWDNMAPSNYQDPTCKNNATPNDGNLWLVDQQGGVWVVQGLVSGLGQNHGPCPPGCGSCSIVGTGTVNTSVSFTRVYPTPDGPFNVATTKLTP